MNYCFGVDVGGTTIKIGMFQFDGKLVDKWEIKTRTEDQGENILPDIADSIKKKMEETGIDKEAVLGIGMGIPAPITEEGIVSSTANLGWGYKEVVREMKELTKVPVVTGNDANVAALGEMWRGGGQGHRNMIMVTLGTGVGGGIIINGECVVGSHGAGGEIGHICVNYNETAKCGCGNRGCLEQYSSATGVVRLAKERLLKENADSLLRSIEDLTAKDVFDAVKKNDALAIEVAEDFGRYLGYALDNLAVACDPTVIVIGGGVSRAGDILFRFIEKYFQERAFFANKDTKFALAQLGNDAGIYGAAKLILK